MEDESKKHQPQGAEPGNSPEHEHSEGPSALFGPVEFYQKAKNFWKTRMAVLGRLPLYDWSSTELRSRGFLGPWKFNITQSSIAAIPGTVSVIVKEFVFGQNEAITLAHKFNKVGEPLVIPFILMTTAYTIGRATAARQSTAAERDRGSRIFLYLDGAYGFYPQLLLSSAAAFGLIKGDPYEGSPTSVAVYYFFWAIACWQLLIYLLYIPEDLFDALGYRAFGLTDRRPNPPKARYWISVLIFIPLLTSVIKTVAAFAEFSLARLIEYLRPFISGWSHTHGLH
jgi:hypothetical protein